MRFSVAPGAIAALCGRDDNRAYYHFYGDLGQLGTIEMFLRSNGFKVVKNDVSPGFERHDKETYIRALRLVFECRVEGWWMQKTDLIENGICTEEEFKRLLHGEVERERERHDLE